MHFVNSIKKNLVWLLLMTSGFTGMLLTGSGCQQNQKKEDIQKVDSLQRIIQRAGDMLIIDEEEVRKRSDSLELKLETLHTASGGKLPEEIAAAMVILDAIRTKYDTFLEEYPSVVFDNNRLAKSIAAYKSAILEGEAKLDPKDYAKFKQETASHLTETETTVRDIREVEDEYYRKSELINPLFHQYHDRKK